jgi:hypothetical protein
MITLQGVDSRMITNNFTPYEPAHPSDILKSEIEYREILFSVTKTLFLPYTKKQNNLSSNELWHVINLITLFKIAYCE